MEEVKVSVITIVFNNERWIEDCIMSVHNQTYKNIEHIVIDGGSTDGTLEVIKKYKNIISDFISEKDEGLYNALNKGIRMAKGDVVGVLHSDDVFYKNNTLYSIVNIFNSTKSDLVYGNGIFVDRFNPSKMKRFYNSKRYKQWYLYWGWIPLHTTMFMKKSVFDAIGYYNEKYRIASDYDFSIRLLRSGIKSYYLNEIIVKMRLGGISTTASLQKKKSLEDLDIIRKNKLWGYSTLLGKIGRKIPQYIKPFFLKIK